MNVRDFPDPKLDTAIPHGIYDTSENAGFVVIGASHDASEFAVNCIAEVAANRRQKLYKDAAKIYIMADCGGSSGYRRKQRKLGLSELSDKINLSIDASHAPSGRPKRSPIEHRLFSFLSINSKGQPLTDYETIMNLYSHAAASTGLYANVKLDKTECEIGKKVSPEQMAGIKMRGSRFHSDWSCSFCTKRRNR